MSAKTATVSKPRPKLSIAKQAAAAPAPESAPAAEPKTPAVPPVVASKIEIVPFCHLKRAPENVRHIRRDEDVDPLADDIQAHGLLQSLIGYRAPDGDDEAAIERVWIVGGGRRLQALGILCDRFVLDLDFPVPVLIRDRADAIEMSLAENLQKRDMSPVDESRAFTALMAPGTTSPLELAKRFGFSEVYVRQRLRLAELAEPIVDALAEKRITLASAEAYARSSDRALQLQVFKQQERSSFDQHDPRRVKADYAAAGFSTDSPLFRFVGAETYERDGGGYEDDLFGEALTHSGGRKLADGPILTAAAERMIALQSVSLLAEIREQHPGVADVVVPPSLRADGYPWVAPRAPAGHTKIEPDYSAANDVKGIWKRIDTLGVEAIAVIGIDDSGQLRLRPNTVFVPNKQAKQIKVEAKPTSYVQRSPEDIERERVAEAIDLKQWRLGVGSFAGTPLEGRAFWPASTYGIRAVEITRDPQLQDGRLVTVQVFVTNAEHDALRDEAKRLVEEERTAEAERKRVAAEAKAAREDLVAELIRMDPPPAVIAIGTKGWYRTVSDDWTDDVEAVDDPDRLGIHTGISSLLKDAPADAAVRLFGSIESFREALNAGEFDRATA